MLAGVSTAMPSLMEAYKLSSRAAQVGFDWPNIDGLFEKLHEETAELQQESERISGARSSAARPGRGRCGRSSKSPKTSRQQHGRGSGRPVLCAGEYCALSVARSRVGAAQDKPKIQTAISVDGGAVARLRTRSAAGFDDGTGVAVAAGQAPFAGRTSGPDRSARPDDRKRDGDPQVPRPG